MFRSLHADVPERGNGLSPCVGSLGKGRPRGDSDQNQKGYSHMWHKYHNWSTKPVLQVTHPRGHRRLRLG